MKIKMLTSLSGPDYSYEANQIAEFEDEEAVRLIEAGIAVPVSGKKVENTMLDPAAKETR